MSADLENIGAQVVRRRVKRLGYYVGLDPKKSYHDEMAQSLLRTIMQVRTYLDPQPGADK